MVRELSALRDKLHTFVCWGKRQRNKSVRVNGGHGVPETQGYTVGAGLHKEGVLGGAGTGSSIQEEGWG